jgi:hypothetical protein
LRPPFLKTLFAVTAWGDRQVPLLLWGHVEAFNEPVAVELEQAEPDRDDVVGGDGGGGDAATVDEGAVAALEVDQVPGVADAV